MGRRRRGAPGAWLVALALRVLHPGVATADDEPGQVVLIADNPDGRLARKIRMELASVHTPVLVRAATDLAAGGAATSRSGGRVVLRVTRGDDGVEVWVRDRKDGPLRFGELVGDPTGAADSSVIAIRTAELVHAALSSLPSPVPSSTTAANSPIGPTAPGDAAAGQAAPREAPAGQAAPREPASDATSPHDATAAQSPGQATPPARVPVRGRAARDEPKPPAPRAFTVRVGASAWFAQGGASPLGSAAVGGSWFFHRRLCAEADLRIPVLFANVHGPEGTATLEVSTLAAGLSFALTPITAAVRPAIGAGLALAWTRAQGTAIAPFVSARADVFSAVPFVRLSTGLALAESVRLRADLLGGLELPGEAIVFAGRRAATSGAPLAEGSLTLEAAWR